MDASKQPEILAARPDELVRAVAREMLDNGLREGRSTFNPARPAWSGETVADLYQRYNLRLDEGAGQFLAKLQRQLEGAPDDTVLLAAELLTLHALPLLNLGPARKRSDITEVLGWMSSPASLPDDVVAAFAQKTWNGGQGIHRYRWLWLRNAVEFVRAFVARPAVERNHMLADPWAWQQILHEHAGFPSLREALKYLAFPGYFLPIVNVRHKNDIRRAFADRLGRPLGDLDRDLLDITLALQAETGKPVEYYQPPLREHWRIMPEDTGRRAWLVRPRQGGAALVDRWQAEGFVSLAAPHLRDAVPGTDLPAVKAAVEAGYQHIDYAQRLSLATEFHDFLSMMDEEDIVATATDDGLHIGVLAGGAAYDPDSEGEQLRRSVTWRTVVDGSHDLLPTPLPGLLDQAGTVVDLTSAADVLSALLGRAESGPASDAPVPVTVGSPLLRDVTDEFAGSLHIGAGWLQDLIDLLAERQQIVLFGPPGTGKTYLAQAVARHVTERDAVRLVQFHPSYAYEDFFEGFRPRESADGSAPGFAKAAGPLRELASEAKNDPARPYVLIIDEINRANVAKVFGELYFLLEYRDASVRLQYSPSEAFSLPRNIFVIGTMNTADRSIALVDAAVRRRFAFVEMHPDEEPVSDVLPRWLAANGQSVDRAHLLRAVNEAMGLEDRDFMVGPSYLMRANLDEPGRLERVWRHDILPVLEEHYFGRLSRQEVLARFGLDAIRARLRLSGPS